MLPLFDGTRCSQGVPPPIKGDAGGKIHLFLASAFQDVGANTKIEEQEADVCMGHAIEPATSLNTQPTFTLQRPQQERSVKSSKHRTNAQH